MTLIRHEKLNIEFSNGRIFGVYPENMCKEQGDLLSDIYSSMPFQLAIAGRSYNNGHSSSWGKCDFPESFEYIGIRERHFGENEYKSEYAGVLSSEAGNITREVCLLYENKEFNILVSCILHFADNVEIARAFTRIMNNGDNEIVLTHLSSVCFPGIGSIGEKKWYDPNKFILNYCETTWHGEGQWRRHKLNELGLYKASSYGVNNSILFSSIGTFSTHKYMPFAVLEDCESQISWVWQIETSSSWYYNIGVKGFSDDVKSSVYLECGTFDERNTGWVKTLDPGEELITPVVSFGAVEGGFEEAIRFMTTYRRNCLFPEKAWNGEFPVCYNDFMNCLWGQPDSEKLIPLIDAAANAGAEMFCIDAGWFGDKNPPYKYAFEYGDWEDSKDRFNEYGLQGIIDYIISKDMLPGIWLEIEVCGDKSRLSQKDDSWFLRRNGIRVGGGARYFLDFTKGKVRDYAMSVIDGLYNRGIRYIKNDYNDDIGIGCDYETTSSPSEGMNIFVRSFYGFIDSVRYKYPDLILENCASGAMREDYGILSRFHLQSSSDQVLYQRYPSIAAGSLACVLPEQLGVWSYPYPIEINEFNNLAILQTSEYKSRMTDGEETIFNMVSGFCGSMYLSGHIDYADSKNMELIKESVELYKSEREFIRNSFPIWPLGLKAIDDEMSFIAQGLINNDNSRALLAVWRRNGDENNLQINLNKYFGSKYIIKQIFPLKSSGFACKIEKCAEIIEIDLPKKNSARLFEILSLDNLAYENKRGVGETNGKN